MILARPRLNKMTSPTTLGPEQQHLEGRSVRDIVEYSPEQVNEVWCRRIFRQILQSLELQYAMHMPHRAITPDTIVFHDNGEPLLTPLDIGPPDDREAEDLTALARVLHYAITQELVPAGPLQGRVDGYSDALLAAVDRCMDPDPAHRPQTIAALRELLGMVPPGAPVRAATPHMMPGLPADDDLAPPAADALAPAGTGGNLPDTAHDTVRNTTHDTVHVTTRATAPDTARDVTTGVPNAAAPAAVVRAGIPPAPGFAPPADAPPSPVHDTAHDTPRDAGIGEARKEVHATVQLAKPDAGHAIDGAATHGANTNSGMNAHTPGTGEHDTAPIAPSVDHAASPPAANAESASTRAIAAPPAAPAEPVSARTAAAPPAAPAEPISARTAATPAAATAGPASARAAAGAPAATAGPASAGAAAALSAATATPPPAETATATASALSAEIAGPASAGTTAAPSAAPSTPAQANAAPPTRRAAGLSRRQRWALAAGGAALLALVLATVVEMRDSGPIEHIDLAAPQPGDGAHGAQDGTAAAPGTQPLPADGAAPAAGTPVAGMPGPMPAGEGAAAGLGPGETLIPGSATPGLPATAQPQPQPQPGVVVTPNGNVYRLQVQPWGVVYVDGVDRGVSPPVKRLTLTPGRHTIRITNPNFSERVLDVDTATGNGQIVVDFTEGAR